MRRKLNDLAWRIGLKLLVWIGCLAMAMGAARAAPICPKGRRYRIMRTAENGMSVMGCSDGKTYVGHVQIRDAKMHLLMDGEYDKGEMNGQWKTYDAKGRVKTRPVFDHGKLLAEDSQADDDQDDGVGGE